MALYSQPYLLNLRGVFLNHLCSVFPTDLLPYKLPALLLVLPFLRKWLICCSPAVVEQAAMTLNFSVWHNDWARLPPGRIWCRSLFYFLFFIFTPKKHHLPSTQRSHTNDPSSTNYHFNYKTLLFARAFGARLLARVRSYALLGTPSLAYLLLAAPGALPASLVTTRFSNFFATSNFCLLAIARQRDRLLYFYKTNNCNSQGLWLPKISVREFTNGATASSSTSV